MPALLLSKTSPVIPSVLSTDPKRVRVLLVEDNVEQAQLTQFLVETGDDDFDVTWKGSLLEAMQYLRDYEIDVVLLDLGMPELESWKSFAAIRVSAPKVPVVVLTTDDNANTRRSLIARGVRYFLLKSETNRDEICSSLHMAVAEGV